MCHSWKVYNVPFVYFLLTPRETHTHNTLQVKQEQENDAQEESACRHFAAAVFHPEEQKLFKTNSILDK